MPKVGFAIVALLAAVFAACIAVPHAGAMMPAAQRLAGAIAISGDGTADQIRYVCRDWCGVGGCYRRCWREPRRYFGYRPYRWRRDRWW